MEMTCALSTDSTLRRPEVCVHVCGCMCVWVHKRQTDRQMEEPFPLLINSVTRIHCWGPNHVCSLYLLGIPSVIPQSAPAPWSLLCPSYVTNEEFDLHWDYSRSQPRSLDFVALLRCSASFLNTFPLFILLVS